MKPTRGSGTATAVSTDLAGSNWLRGRTDCAAVCAHLGDTARATVWRDLLTRYADQIHVVAPNLLHQALPTAQELSLRNVERRAALLR